MPKAVRFDSYGGIDVLQVRDVPRPVPRAGEVLVEVKAAGINPSEAAIRSGAVRHIFPATFPSGRGSDLAGGVAELGPGVSGFTVGDEVIGFSMRPSSHAEYVTVSANQFGQSRVSELLQSPHGHEVVAITRTPETISGPAQGRFGDYNRPESLAEAYVGLDRLLIITTVDPEPGKHGAQNVPAMDTAAEVWGSSISSSRRPRVSSFWFPVHTALPGAVRSGRTRHHHRGAKRYDDDLRNHR